MHLLRSRLLLAALAAPLATGCHLHGAHSAVEGAVLGRVVIYRNGVAFYERHATAHDGQLTVRVPRERVDDFLKSLTVVDPTTHQPLSVTIPRTQEGDGGGGSLTMTLENPDHPNADVLLTYVTEAPAWKPSYRVVVGPAGKVMLEGWAIVDNVSGEDWKSVQVGVGASSALAFRYDLWSVRHVDRDLLAGEERFAIAPPTGVSPYSADVANSEELLDFAGEELGTSFSGSTSLENQYTVDGVSTTSTSSAPPAPKVGSLFGQVTEVASHQPLAGVTVIAAMPGGESLSAITDEAGQYRIASAPAGAYTVTYYYGDATAEQQRVQVAASKATPINVAIREGGGKGEVIQIAARAPVVDPTSTTQGMTLDKTYVKSVPVAGRTFESVLGAAAGSQADGGSSAGEADAARAKLAASKLKASVARVLKDRRDVVLEVHGATQAEAAAHGNQVRDRLVDEGVPAAHIHVSTKVAPGEAARVRVLAVAPGTPAEGTAPPRGTSAAGGDTPVGESRFMAERPMTVKAGSSAMVAMVHGETTGGVVYLYDPVSERGDQRFAFRAVQLDNPTGDTLEPGPVTVYGDRRFIGEGITEPVPPHASVVVPFALDKQIIVEHTGDESDRIAKLVTVQRGVVTAEIQHRRTTTLTLTSRLAEPAKVFLRHKVEAGWDVTEAPPRKLRVGDSDLYEVDLAPGATQHVVLAESTPMDRTLELSSPEALALMQVYVDDPQATPELVEQLRALLATHRGAADLVDRIATLRDELSDYRARAGELHAQLVTLKAVHTGGDLMTGLRARLTEISDRVQKATLALVDAQEQLMLARVKFGNQLADLHLGAPGAPGSVTQR